MATEFTPGSSSGQEDKPLPSRPSDANNRTIVIQQNYMAEGVTINICSSNSYGSTVTKLEHTAAQPGEPTSLQRPLTRELAPVDYGRESVVVNGNTFGEYAVINIASPYSTGAGALLFLAIIQSSKPLSHPLAGPETEPETEPRAEPIIFSGGRIGFGADVSSVAVYDDSQFSVLVVFKRTYVTCYEIGL
ncbi:uncharacterized protein BJ212DRAFT_1474514 [Suillus subaureus]|uniref:Uncharacterized protein n=1 Tax=Suillus subaureus TaxID=48587 RepID=A0A9P7EQK2_9AGAM|nr:uncharacterized protein BJ212DRAFT_1474514 [Suillus subaureus]KAG1827363.1 hypothetical protein BJ212DRAFT_1474514 [Suillus subaureus]